MGFPILTQPPLLTSLECSSHVTWRKVYWMLIAVLGLAMHWALMTHPGFFLEYPPYVGRLTPYFLDGMFWVLLP